MTMMQVGIQDIQLMQDQATGRNTGFKVYRTQVGVQDIKFIQDYDTGRSAGYTA